jgi:hypothetical protein
MTELQQFIAMLDRAGIGHGMRIDYDPCGTAVQVEHAHDEGDGWTVTDWQFDADGRLVDISMYPGEEG